MSEIAANPRTAHHAGRWLIAVYALLAAASVTTAAGALLGSPTGRVVAFIGTAAAVVAWTFSLIRLRRPAMREIEQRNQRTAAAWFAASVAAYVLISQYPQVPVAWPVLLAALAAATALYGAVREAVR